MQVQRCKKKAVEEEELWELREARKCSTAPTTEFVTLIAQKKTPKKLRKKLEKNSKKICLLVFLFGAAFLPPFVYFVFFCFLFFYYFFFFLGAAADLLLLLLLLLDLWRLLLLFDFFVCFSFAANVLKARRRLILWPEQLAARSGSGGDSQQRWQRLRRHNNTKPQPTTRRRYRLRSNFACVVVAAATAGHLPLLEFPGCVCVRLEQSFRPPACLPASLPAVSAAEQLAPIRGLVLVSASRTERTRCRLAMAARCDEHSPLPVRFSLRFVFASSPALALARFSSFRFVSPRLSLSLSLSCLVSPLVTGAMARPPGVPCRLTFCQSFSSAPSSASPSPFSPSQLLNVPPWHFGVGAMQARLLAVRVRFT